MLSCKPCPKGAHRLNIGTAIWVWVGRLVIGRMASQVALSVKESACQCRRCQRLRFIPGLGIPSAEGNGNPFQCYCLGNSRDRGPWEATVHRATRSRTD